MWRRRPKQHPIATYKHRQQLEQRRQRCWFWWDKVGASCQTSMLMMGLGDDGVCIDYRIRLMGHNSQQACQRSVRPPELWTEQPPQTRTRHIKLEEGSAAVCLAATPPTSPKNSSALKTSCCCSCKTEKGCTRGLVWASWENLCFPV